MLIEQDLKSIHAIATNLATRGLSIVPKEDTHLHDMVSMSMPSFWDKEKSALENILETSNYIDPAEENDHGIVKNGVAVEKAKEITELMNLTRTVVIPLCKTLYAALQETHLQQEHYKAQSAAYKIVQVEKRAIAENPLLDEYTENYQNVVFEDMHMQKFFIGSDNPVMTREAIANALVAGTELDAIVEECLKEKVAVDEVVSFFAGELSIEDTTQVSIHGAILIMLMAGVLYDNPADGVSGITLSEWNLEISRIISVSGKLVRMVCAKERNRISDRLYTGRIEHNVIEVNGEFYRQSLDKGLTPEVLVGHELRGRPHVSVEDIILNKDSLLNAYNAFESSIAEQYSLDRLNTSVRFLIGALRKHIDEQLLDDDKEVPMSRLGLVADASYAEKRDISDYDLVVRMVCALLYHDKDVYVLITMIDRVAASQPDLDMRSVLTYVLFEYVVTWTSNQTYLVK